MKKVVLATVAAAVTALALGSEAQAQVMVQTQMVAPQPIMVQQGQPMMMQQPGGVMFRNAAGGPVPVEVNGAGGCMMPCSLPLGPGNYMMNVGGRFSQMISVPMVPTLVDYYPRNVGNIVGGAIMLGIGAPLALGGIIALGYGFFALSYSTFGIVPLVVGVVLLAVGVPLAIVGGLRIARSGPYVAVRPGMMGAVQQPSRSRFAMTSGVSGDSVNGGSFSTMGFTF